MSVNQSKQNNDLNSIGLMGKFLSKISPKELKSHKSFHEVIQKKEEKLNKYVLSNSHFSELTQSTLHYKKVTNLKPNPKKNIRKMAITRQQKEQSPLENTQNNKRSLSVSIILPKIKQCNNINNFLMMNNEIAEETIDKELQNELIKEQDILFETNKKKKKIRGLSESKIPWFMKINKEDKLHPLLDSSNTNKRNAKCINEPEEKNNFLGIMKDAFHYQEPYISRSIYNDHNIKKYHKMNKLYQLYQKCKNNIDRGISINKYIGKHCEIFNEVSNEIQQKKKKMTQNKDRALIEEKKKEEESKYDLMKEEIIARRKKKINQLISETFAHNNRADFEKKLKEYEREDPYELFLLDLNNEAFATQKRIDRENYQLDLIVNILDNTIKDKANLKGKIEEQSEKYRIISGYNSTKVSYPASNEYFQRSSSQNNIQAKKNMIRHKSFDAISREVYEELRAENKKKRLKGNRETIF